MCLKAGLTLGVSTRFFDLSKYLPQIKPNEEADTKKKSQELQEDHNTSLSSIFENLKNSTTEQFEMLYSKYKSQHEYLFNQIQELEEKNKELSIIVEEHKKKINYSLEAFSRDKDASVETITILNQTITELSDQVAKLEENLDQKEEENKGMKRELKSMEEQRTKQLQDLVHDTQQLEALLQSYQHDLIACQNENARSRSTLRVVFFTAIGAFIYFFYFKK